MKDLLFTLNAIMPIIFTIALGYILKRIKFFNKDFLKQANKLVFRVCLPTLLFYNVYEIQSFKDISWKFVGYIMIGVLALFFIGLILVKIFIQNPKQKGVVLQAFFRSNYAFIGIPLAASLAANLSDSAANAVKANAALASAFGIPLFNILAVIALSIFVSEEVVEGQLALKKKISIKKILLDIAKNPLIIGVAVGFVALGIRAILEHFSIDFTLANDAKFFFGAVKNVSVIASPLALIVLGGQFEFNAIAKLKKQIIFSTVVRCVFVPLFGLGIAYALGFRTKEFPAFIGIFATPIAISSVPMAAEMGQDDELAGQIVVWTSLMSAISLFIIILACRGLNIF